jgi:uncharacterized protein YndB with AHSA1/START domain
MSMTTNEQSVIDGFTVRRTIHINAPIEKVWAAVTEPQHLAKWFPDRAALEPVAVGATGTFAWDDYGTQPVIVEALDAPTSISYRWGNETPGSAAVDPDHSTVFTFTLAEVAGGTRLTVTETGFETLADPAAGLESNRGGWNFELDELVTYLEGAA